MTPRTKAILNSALARFNAAHWRTQQRIKPDLQRHFSACKRLGISPDAEAVIEIINEGLDVRNRRRLIEQAYRDRNREKYRAYYRAAYYRRKDKLK